jgi:hypothetical protein
VAAFLKFGKDKHFILDFTWKLVGWEEDFLTLCHGDMKKINGR